MDSPGVVFYCRPGLEAAVLEQAMTNLNFQVRLVFKPGELLAALQPDRHMVLIVDSDGRHEELAELLPAVRARLMSPDVPVFVMDGKEKFETDLPSIYRVPAEHRLKGAIIGISTYLRSLRQPGLDLQTPRRTE